MKNILKFITIFIFIPILAHAESKLGIINDPDGYTNVREGRGTNTKIIYQLKENEIFYFEPDSNTDWWEINRIFKAKGFVHKSRIYPLDKIPDIEQKKVILEIFKREYDLCNSIKKNKNHDELSDHHESQYDPALTVFKEYVCKNKDIELMEFFIKIKMTGVYSADEWPDWVLGDIYLCQPEWTLNIIKQKQSEKLNSCLLWGFLNVTYKKENQITNFNELKSNIVSLPLPDWVPKEHLE